MRTKAGPFLSKHTRRGWCQSYTIGTADVKGKSGSFHFYWLKTGKTSPRRELTSPVLRKWKAKSKIHCGCSGHYFCLSNKLGWAILDIFPISFCSAENTKIRQLRRKNSLFSRQLLTMTQAAWLFHSPSLQPRSSLSNSAGLPLTSNLQEPGEPVAHILIPTANCDAPEL